MGSVAKLQKVDAQFTRQKKYSERWYFRKKNRTIRARKKSEQNTLTWCSAEAEEMHEEETDYLFAIAKSVFRRHLGSTVAAAHFPAPTLRAALRIQTQKIHRI